MDCKTRENLDLTHRKWIARLVQIFCSSSQPIGLEANSYRKRRLIKPADRARGKILVSPHQNQFSDKDFEWRGQPMALNIAGTSLLKLLADFARSDPWIPTLKLDPPWGVTVNLMACHRETPSARSIVKCDRESDGVTSGGYVRSRGGRQPPKCAEKYRPSKAAGQRCAVKARGAWRFVMLEGGQPGSSFRER